MPPVEEVRALFEARLSEGIPTPPGEFHPFDVENRVKNDNYIKRLLLHQDDDVKAAADMLWEICIWRQTVGANEINEGNLNMPLIREGGMFPHGRDIESSLLLIFRCKMHVKVQKEFEELKKCIIYWFDRIEREENGRPITLFFDLDGCGVSNIDMEFIKYLISLMKYYYPAFLQYIVIFQMPWVMSAAFKVIKNLLPAKAVSKMKFLSKDTLKELVAPEQALVSWGGTSDYVFKFIPEVRNADQTPKKVTFVELEDQHSDGEMLKLVPNDTIVFNKENDELSGSVTITNMDESPVSFKIRTTAPEKFRVRPSFGQLAVGATQTVVIVVQPGFHFRNVTKDRFLIMSVQIPNTTLSAQENTEIWKKSKGSKVDEYRLKCQFPYQIEPLNGNVFTSEESKTDVEATLKKLHAKCDKMNRSLELLKIYQFLTMIMTIIAVYFGYLAYNNSEYNGSSM